MNDDNSTISSLLQSLGVSPVEAATYMALLDMDSISIRKIAAETGINRGTTYDALKRLVAVGLVSVRRNGQREQYSAESPERIYEIIRDKRRDLADASEVARQVIPSIMAGKVSRQGKPLVRYYEGDDGVATILRDVLQTCRMLDKPHYYAYSSRPVRQYLYRHYPQFTERRIAEDIGVSVIAVGAGGEETTKASRRWLPEPRGSDISSYTLIYGPKVAIVSLTGDNTPYGVVIEDAGAAAMQRLLFEQIWITADSASPAAVK